MRLQWKEVPTGDGVVGQWAALYVTMNPKGQIRLSRVTHAKMDEPAAYTVLFDEKNNIIGLKPCHLSARNARRACVLSKWGGIGIHAYRLIQDQGIRLPQTIQFVDPEIDHDGILQLDLRTAKVSPHSLAHRRRRGRTPEGTYPIDGDGVSPRSGS